ncbi:MAG: DNA-3-methyladenine glycosylase [Chloroflexota bacterium]|nr:DNA-3-methyladenine glycosylase [Chloroflexota bacterium]
MKVTVRLGEPLWRATGSLRHHLEFPQHAVSVADVLAGMAATYPDFQGHDLARPLPYQVYLNARLVPDGEEETWQLQDGDRLHIFLPAAGGQRSVLSMDFYAKPTLEVARSLLGQRLVRKLGGNRLSGRIVEVEAYIGEDDQACHAACGPTKRNRIMYGRPGLAYVYLIYGMYFCLNVVTENEGLPAAILIRGIEPIEGEEIMMARRSGRPRSQMTNGPGKLCQALAIDRSFAGHDLTAGTALWLEGDQPLGDDLVVSTPRINVRGDQLARTIPWRFVVRGF